MFEDGFGGPRNLQGARRLYALAATQVDESAQANLARLDTAQVSPSVSGVAARNDPPTAGTEELIQELSALIGSTSVKQEVAGLVNLMRVRQQHIAQELPVPEIRLIVILAGYTDRMRCFIDWNPGGSSSRYSPTDLKSFRKCLIWVIIVGM